MRHGGGVSGFDRENRLAPLIGVARAGKVPDPEAEQEQEDEDEEEQECEQEQQRHHDDEEEDHHLADDHDDDQMSTMTTQLGHSIDVLGSPVERTHACEHASLTETPHRRPYHRDIRSANRLWR